MLILALEEMGYLVQPHKSAGRVPSSKAYRYYVDNLIDRDAIDRQMDNFVDYFDSLCLPYTFCFLLCAYSFATFL